jgi:hypothetical protein
MSFHTTMPSATSSTQPPMKEVHVGYVSNAAKFIVSPLRSLSNINQIKPVLDLETRLSKNCRRLKKMWPTHLVEGAAAVVEVSEGQWRRAKVASVEDGAASVILVDTGDVLKSVDADKCLRQIPSAFSRSKTPALAENLFLADLSPRIPPNWPKEATSMVRKFVANADRTFLLDDGTDVVLYMGDGDMENGHLLSRRREAWVSVRKILLEAGFAAEDGFTAADDEGNDAAENDDEFVTASDGSSDSDIFPGY